MESATVVSTNEEYLWQSCLGELESRFSKPIFEMWIKPMRVERLATDEVTLTVQNAFAKDWAENRLKGTIVATLTHIIGSPIAVRFVIGRDGKVSNVADGGSDIPDPEVRDCVLKAFYQFEFPQPEGGIVTVVYPIMLAPG